MAILNFAPGTKLARETFDLAFELKQRIFALRKMAADEMNKVVGSDNPQNRICLAAIGLDQAADEYLRSLYLLLYALITGQELKMLGHMTDEELAEFQMFMTAQADLFAKYTQGWAKGTLLTDNLDPPAEAKAILEQALEFQLKAGRIAFLLTKPGQSDCETRTRSLTGPASWPLKNFLQATCRLIASSYEYFYSIKTGRILGALMGADMAAFREFLDFRKENKPLIDQYFKNISNLTDEEGNAITYYFD